MLLRVDTLNTFGRKYFSADAAVNFYQRSLKLFS